MNRGKKRSAEDLVEALSGKSLSKDFGPYITHIRFPLFKNLQRDARIDFEFPLTALVGPNGCGKTSAMHALYGAPMGKSSSEFWFTTEVDPILEGSGEPNRFIYGHILFPGKKPVETRKARVGSKNRRPGYFEPTKAVSGDKMDLSPFPCEEPVKGQSKDRWNPVERPLLYLNFRSELSAFDKFFYFGDARPTPQLKTLQDRIQRDAKRLNRAIAGDANVLELHGRRMLNSKEDVSSEELIVICDILGKAYTSATLIRHSYYGYAPGLSVLFRTSTSTYTEAFAGSGEHSVVSLVTSLMRAKKHTLVLLDEPEVSLHPGAQKRLLSFLLEQILRHGHQVVLSTHSPSLIEALPESAIKVFFQDVKGRFGIMQSAHPYAAFSRIGASPPDTIKILVEDRLAAHVIDIALLNLEVDDRKLFEVDYLPGGSKTYLAHRIPTLMHQKGTSFLYLDGDQKPRSLPAPAGERSDLFQKSFPSPFAGEFPNPEEIAPAANAVLGELVDYLAGCKVLVGADGGDTSAHEAQKVRLYRQYLQFAHRHVFFLPRRCPEEIVLAALGEKIPSTSEKIKTKLASMVREKIGESSSSEIDSWCKVQLGDRRVGNADLNAVSNKLRALIPLLGKP